MASPNANITRMNSPDELPAMVRMSFPYSTGGTTQLTRVCRIWQNPVVIPFADLKENIVANPSQRTISPEQILHLAKHKTKPLRLQTVADVLPGGLSAAMAPMFIDWDASEIEGPDGFVIVQNVNYGGNPIEGTTVLQTVTVPLGGLERVEWILVPLSKGGRQAPIHHGQLRFVFREDCPMRLLDVTGRDGGGRAEMYDLVASWEAWRKPEQDYDALQGMDSGSYSLALRLYAGPQRFLEDALGGRDWYSSPLRLPGGAEGPAELLKVVLALGDGGARHTISELFSRSMDDWLAHAPVSDHADLTAQWRKMEELARPREAIDDARINLPPEERDYQTVLRSCATMAYYAVTVAVDRLAERGLDDGVESDKLERIELGGDQTWMSEVSGTDLSGIIMRAPLALRWLRSHPLAIPSRIPGSLDKAGLVAREKGKPVEHHYAMTGTTPYGKLSDNLLK